MVKLLNRRRGRGELAVMKFKKEQQNRLLTIVTAPRETPAAARIRELHEAKLQHLADTNQDATQYTLDAMDLLGTTATPADVTEFIRRFWPSLMPKPLIAKTHFSHDELFGICECGDAMVDDHTSGYMVCCTCGMTRVSVPHVDRTSSEAAGPDSSMRVTSVHLYKRQSHLRALLVLISGTSRIKASATETEKLRSHLDGVDKEMITPSFMFTELGKLKLHKLRVIRHRLAEEYSDGLYTCPSIEDIHTNRIMAVFNAIDDAYNIIAQECVEARKNFMSYPFCLYQICKLLEYDFILPHLQLLKCKVRLENQRRLWKRLCLVCEFPSILTKDENQ
jgi:hypothetical protein